MLKAPSYHLCIAIQCSTWFSKSQLVCKGENKNNTFKNSSRPHLMQTSFPFLSLLIGSPTTPFTLSWTAPRDSRDICVGISAAAGCVSATGFCLFPPCAAICKTESVTWKTVGPAGETESGAVNHGGCAVAPGALCVGSWGFHSDNCHHPPQYHQYLCIPSTTLQQHCGAASEPEEGQAGGKDCICNSPSICKFILGAWERTSWNSLCSA